jgi:hypothetical protein
MRCVICGKGIPDVPALHRINQKGVKGLWACDKHLSQTDGPPVDPEVLDIIKVLS